MIFGIPGSGKSTFTIQLSKLLQLPVEYLNTYFFAESWAEQDYSQLLQIQGTLLKNEKWIIDGDAIGSFEMRFMKVDVAIYFCFNRFLWLYRIFKRLFSKDHRISDRADDALRYFGGLLFHVFKVSVVDCSI